MVGLLFHFRSTWFLAFLILKLAETAITQHGFFMMVVICRDSFHPALTARQLMDGAVFVVGLVATKRKQLNVLFLSGKHRITKNATSTSICDVDFNLPSSP